MSEKELGTKTLGKRELLNVCGCMSNSRERKKYLRDNWGLLVVLGKCIETDTLFRVKTNLITSERCWYFFSHNGEIINATLLFWCLTPNSIKYDRALDKGITIKTDCRGRDARVSLMANYLGVSFNQPKEMMAGVV